MVMAALKGSNYSHTTRLYASSCSRIMRLVNACSLKHEAVASPFLLHRHASCLTQSSISLDSDVSPPYINCEVSRRPQSGVILFGRLPSTLGWSTMAVKGGEGRPSIAMIEEMRRGYANRIESRSLNHFHVFQSPSFQVCRCLVFATHTLKAYDVFKSKV